MGLTSAKVSLSLSLKGWEECTESVITVSRLEQDFTGCILTVKFHENTRRCVHVVEFVYSIRRSTERPVSPVWAGQVSATSLCSGLWMELHLESCLFKDCFMLVSWTSSSIVAIKGNIFLPSNRSPVMISSPYPGGWVQRPTYPVSVSAKTSLFLSLYWRLFHVRWHGKFTGCHGQLQLNSN